jgi:hypothetical protein
MTRKIRALGAFAAALLAATLFSPALSAQAAIASDPHLAKALELRGEALSAYDLGDYDAAAELAARAKAELALIAAPISPTQPAQPAQPATVAQGLAPLPAAYTVRRIPEDRDCLSKIAGYPFVYGDRSKWKELYRANKGTLLHPENADILLPDELLIIPSIAGEKREGAYDPSFEYESFAVD